MGWRLLVESTGGGHADLPTPTPRSQCTMDRVQPLQIMHHLKGHPNVTYLQARWEVLNAQLHKAARAIVDLAPRLG